ncbi:hypothetical protein Ancab_012345 [Ancistrocladus abbreviatus]
MEAFSGSLRGLGQLMGFAVNPSPFIYCSTGCRDRLDAVGSSLTSACCLGLLSRIFDFCVGLWVVAKAVRVFVCAAGEVVQQQRTPLDDRGVMYCCSSCSTILSGASICGSRLWLLCRWVEVDNGGWRCHFVVDITGVFSDGLERMWGAAFLGIVLPEILPKPTLEDGVLLWGEVCSNSFFSGALLSVLKLGGNVLWLWLWLMLNGGRFS